MDGSCIPVSGFDRGIRTGRDGCAGPERSVLIGHHVFDGQRVHIVHHGFHYAIVDEADSILIDEARIPLIIAGAAEDTPAESEILAEIAKKLKAETDFQFDEHFRNVSLTDSGLKSA